MATYGLKNLYRAPITIAQNGTITYGTPVKMAAAISVDISVEFKEGRIDSDDITKNTKEFRRAQITINQEDLSPADRAAILGETQDDDDVVYSSTKDEPPHFAIGYQMAMPGGKYTYKWLYDVQFTVPNENAKTDKEDAFEYVTPSIVGEVRRRESDGLWQATYVATPDDTIAAGWFTAVREPRQTAAA